MAEVKIGRRALVFGLVPGGLAAGVRGREIQVDLFRQGDGGVHTYRIPALVETRKRTLIAVVDARHESARDLPARISLAMRRSFDGGRNWTATEIIRPAPEGGGVGDPSLLIERAAAGGCGVSTSTGRRGSVFSRRARAK